MTRHASAELIARFQAGELPARRSGRIRAHLAGCPRCARTEASLADVTALLASSQAPPIPEHLSARIENALATEAARRAARPASAAASTRNGAGHRRVSVTKPPRQRRAVLWSPAGLRALAGAAAVVLIGGGGYAVFSQLGGGTSGPSSAAAPDHRAAASGVPPGAANQPGRLGGSARYGPSLRYGTGNATFTLVVSGTNFQPGTLAAQVQAEISATRSSLRAAGPAQSTAPPNHPTADFGQRQATLAACVSRVAAGRRVVLVELARYRGVPATVIVTEPRNATAAGRQIYVVGAGCSARSLDLLHHQSPPARLSLPVPGISRP